MRKLTLKIADLEVESFAATPGTEPGQGTVKGLQEATGPLPGCSTYACASDETNEFDCYTNMTRCEQNTCYPRCVEPE